MSDKKGQKKSNLWKWLLGCGCLVVLAGVAGVAALGGGLAYFISKGVTTDPAKAKEMSDSIYASELPAGYEMKFGMSMLGWRMAAFASKGDGGSESGMFGMVMQVPKSMGMDKKSMETQMSEQAKKNAGRNQGQVEEAEEVTLRVGSEDVKATMQTTVDQDKKQKNVQYLIFLDKPKGNIMIIVSGPEKSFDESGMKSYLRSIKFKD